MQAFHPLSPVVFSDSKMLILGSFPSIKSFESNFYYAHPRNQFWPILSSIYKMKIETRDEKIALLEASKIAIWDVVKSCERINSSDSNLKNITLNDIEELLKKYKNLKRIFFTSKAALKFYKKGFSHLNIDTFTLPSPSPAYAAMRFEEKVRIWKEELSLVC